VTSLLAFSTDVKPANITLFVVTVKSTLLIIKIITNPYCLFIRSVDVGSTFRLLVGTCNAIGRRGRVAPAGRLFLHQLGLPELNPTPASLR
jgi:hypothetical protein